MDKTLFISKSIGKEFDAKLSYNVQEKRLTDFCI